MELPFSVACERNKKSILSILREALAECNEVLEIGSGTGQHAVHFGTHLPWLTWQAAEMLENQTFLRLRLEREAPENVKAPLVLDVREADWNAGQVDAVFTANTFHIMSWEAVKSAFIGIGKILRTPGVVCVYGPYNYEGQYTSKSNAAFDQTLQGNDPLRGIRDFEAVNELALQQGLTLINDHAMPANIRTLVWTRP